MMEWLVVAPVLLGGGWVGAAAWLDFHGRRALPSRSYDAIVVAGCRVFPDGRPSAALSRRVRLAVELYHRGVAPKLVLTGGVGEDAPISEARAAADLCVAWGVPHEHLVLEEASTTTQQNAAFSAQLFQGTVLVVSDSAHVFRCRRMFARHFPEVHAVGAIPPRGPRARLALREVFAVVRHAALGNL